MEGTLTVKHEGRKNDDLDVLTSCPNCNNYDIESLIELCERPDMKIGKQIYHYPQLREKVSVQCFGGYGFREYTYVPHLCENCNSVTFKYRTKTRLNIPMILTSCSLFLIFALLYGSFLATFLVCVCIRTYLCIIPIICTSILLFGVLRCVREEHKILDNNFPKKISQEVFINDLNKKYNGKNSNIVSCLMRCLLKTNKIKKGIDKCEKDF